MSAAHASVGPWIVRKSEKPQAGGLDWYVSREIRHTEPTEWTDREQIRDVNGDHMRFISEEAARAAIQNAASPELLAACQFVFANAFMRKWDGDERGYEMLRSAIALATPYPTTQKAAS